MIINLKGCERINDELAGAIYDLTGQGNSAPPGFDGRTPINVKLTQHGRLTATQGDLSAIFEDGEWLTWSSCDRCGLAWASDDHPEDAECPRCEAIRTKDRGDW